MVDKDGLEIRIGGPDDLDECMQLALRLTEENGFMEPDPSRIVVDMYCALHGDHGLVGIIGKPGGAIEGAVLLRIGKLFYSNKDILEEKGLYIHEDYRSAKGGRARKLCRFSKMAADKLGLPLLIGVLSNNRTEAKVRMYEREFGPPSGAFFLHGAKTGEFSLAEHS